MTNVHVSIVVSHIANIILIYLLLILSSVKPRDNSEVEQMRFDLFGNGTGTLNVTSTDRDAISFSGRIEKLSE